MMRRVDLFRYASNLAVMFSVSGMETGPDMVLLHVYRA